MRAPRCRRGWDRRPAVTAGICRRQPRPGHRRFRPRRVQRGSERSPVTESAAVIHRHHDVALVGQPLVDAVGPVIELHVVIAEQHLPHRSAVDEDDGGTLLAGLEILRQKQLVVDVEAVRRLGHDQLRLHVRVGRKLRARGDDIRWADGVPAPRRPVKRRLPLALRRSSRRRGRPEPYTPMTAAVPACAERARFGLIAAPGGSRCSPDVTRRGGTPPATGTAQMGAAVSVGAVRLSVGRQRHRRPILDQSVRRREQDRCGSDAARFSA
jgi:hypothetical protein